jgi:hypothetical protein
MGCIEACLASRNVKGIAKLASAFAAEVIVLNGTAMGSDVVVSRELKALQEELSASQRERLAAPANTSAATAAAADSARGRNRSDSAKQAADQTDELQISCASL